MVDPDRPHGGGKPLQLGDPNLHHTEGIVQALERTAVRRRGQAANQNKGHTRQAVRRQSRENAPKTGEM